MYLSSKFLFFSIYYHRVTKFEVGFFFHLHREKPHDEEWLALREQKIPLLLNFSQCKLLASEFYPVIEHCTEVLEIDPGTILHGVLYNWIGRLFSLHITEGVPKPLNTKIQIF